MEPIVGHTFDRVRIIALERGHDLESGCPRGRFAGREPAELA
jgi:hypothetical protein